MRKYNPLGMPATLMVLCLWSVSGLAQTMPLRFGVFPHLSTRVLLEVYQPLADHLSQALNRPVTLETAPDFADFLTRTREGRYDLLFTPPHLAYLAQSETGYRPLYAYTSPLYGLLVVRKHAPYQSLRDLKGKPLAMADPLGIVVMMMEAELSRAGLRQGRDFTRIEARSHNNAALLVIQGKAQGAVMGTMAFQRLPAQIRQDLRPLVHTRPILSPVYLANSKLPAAEVEALKAALKGFAATAPGHEFFKQGGLGDLLPVSAAQLQEFGEYGREAARRLKRRRVAP